MEMAELLPDMKLANNRHGNNKRYEFIRRDGFMKFGYQNKKIGETFYI